MTDFLERRGPTDDPRLPAVFDELSFWSSRFGHHLFRHLALVRGVRGLDLGCGTGFPLLELAEAHGPSCRFAGVDLWKEALDRARLKLEVRGSTNACLVRADGAALPFPDGEFDLIVSNLGINNFEDLPAALAECRRIAAPRARLVITTNPRGHMREFYDLYRRALIDLGLSRYLERLTAQEDHRTSREALRALLEGHGFRVTRELEDRFHLRYLDGGALFRHFLTRIGFLEGWRSVVDPADEEKVFALLERRLDDIAQRDGEIRMTVPMLYMEGEAA